jgi:imidazolonepropionase-like amidohydrolase
LEINSGNSKQWPWLYLRRHSAWRNVHPGTSCKPEVCCHCHRPQPARPGAKYAVRHCLACRYYADSAEAIAAAINAAAAIGRADRIGSIEPGKQADLLILSEPDYRHLRYRFGTNLVQTVIKKGKVYPV